MIISLFKKHYLFAIGLALSIIAIALHQGSNLFASTFGHTLMKQVDSSHWDFDFQNIESGDYYLSLGRPHGRCTISIDGRPIDSTTNEISPLRSSLLLGAPVRIQNDTKQAVSLECDSSSRVAFTHKPLLLPLQLGMAVQLWRALTELVIGPLFSLCLLLVAVILSRITLSDAMTQSSAEKTKPSRTLYLLLFSFVSLAYSLSLAHFPRLFLNDSFSNLVHILLRHSFSGAFALLICMYAGRQVLWIHYLLGLSACVTVFSYFAQESSMMMLYPYQAVLFPLSSAVATRMIFSIEARSRAIEALKGIAVTWTIAQIFDIVSFVLKVNAYSSPILIVLITSCFALVAMLEHTTNAKNYDITVRVLRILQGNETLPQMLSSISGEIAQSCHFARVSAYIDAYCVGEASVERRKFLRVKESGYAKATKDDWIIDTSDGRGQKMAKAMQDGRLTVGQGRNRASYAIVPIGPHACINFSDNQPAMDFRIYESLQSLEQLHKAAAQLRSSISDSLFKTRIAMQHLRGSRQIGVHEIEMGAIFFDVVGFSKLTERFGDRFAQFLSENYFAAIVRKLEGLAVKESSAGDEMYFPVFGDIIKGDLSVKQATIKSVRELLDFVSGEGAAMCREAGYLPIQLRGGANYGSGKLIVGDVDVTTAGNCVNYAKRFMEFARSGEFLAGEELVQDSAIDFVIGEQRMVLVKQNHLRAYPICRVGAPRLVSDLSGDAAPAARLSV